MSDRFTTSKSGYVFDKRIFRLATLLVLVPGVFIMFFGGYGLTNLYLHCPAESLQPCLNPCYLDSHSLCEPFRNQEYLPVGFEFGEDPRSFTRVFEGWLGFIVLVFLFAFLYNHIANNKGKRIGGVKW